LGRAVFSPPPLQNCHILSSSHSSIDLSSNAIVQEYIGVKSAIEAINSKDAHTLSVLLYRDHNYENYNRRLLEDGKYGENMAPGLANILLGGGANPYNLFDRPGRTGRHIKA
jgi:hypothetical protein